MDKTVRDHPDSYAAVRRQQFRSNAYPTVIHNRQRVNSYVDKLVSHLGHFIDNPLKSRHRVDQSYQRLGVIAMLQGEHSPDSLTVAGVTTYAPHCVSRI